MNSVSRYFLVGGAWGDGDLVLGGDEAHHCVRVLRQGVGDEVEVFDGVGGRVRGRIVSAGKGEVVVERLGEVVRSERGLEVSLCQAVPKGGNMEWIVQKAVELGVGSIQPLVTENTVVKVDAKKVEKWRRVALEACKQCGQDWLPEVRDVTPFSEWLRGSERAEVSVVAALDPRSRPLREVLGGVERGVGSVELLVGPEGDFSEVEYDGAIEAGFLAAGLGEIVLRVETATFYCLSVLGYELGEEVVEESDGPVG